MRTPGLPLKPILLARCLLIFTAAILFVFSAATFLRISPKTDMQIIYLAYGILMLGDGIAMLAGGLWINNKKIYWFVVVVLALNILLTIFDQFGMIDLLFVLLNAITLFFLLRFRKEFLPS